MLILVVELAVVAVVAVASPVDEGGCCCCWFREAVVVVVVVVVVGSDVVIYCSDLILISSVSGNFSPCGGVGMVVSAAVAQRLRRDDFMVSSCIVVSRGC